MLNSKFLLSIVLSFLFFINVEGQFSKFNGEFRAEDLRFQTTESFLAQIDQFSVFKNQLKSSSFWIDLPLPDGTFKQFEFTYDPIMEAGLSKKYPDIKTFKVKAKGYRGRADFSLHGFHAMILAGDKYILIDPASNKDQSVYMSYYASSLIYEDDRLFSCEVSDNGLDESIVTPKVKNTTSIMGLKSANTPVDLKTYRLAVACTGEYASFHGGTVESALAAIVTTFNRVNTVYEIEHAIRLDIIENNDEIIFLNAQDDPYTNNNLSNMLNQNRTTLSSIIGNDNFDIGHVLGTFGGGLAQLGSVCTSSKARGATGLPNPVGDFFDVVYVCHEVGHQFDATHTFNFCDGENESPNTAYEPASGTTIMAYAGLCGAQNLQANTDFHFHTASLEQVKVFSTEGTGSTCGNFIEINNTSPVVTVETAQDLFVPIQTPFEIVGYAEDQEDDNLLLNWEQFDLGPQSTIGQPEGTAPLFATQIPQSSGRRFLPRFQDIINNQTSVKEVLPSITRPMTFRLTARDQNELGGGTSWALLELIATADAGPFIVTAPQGGETLRTQMPYAIKWDVANTDLEPVNCQTVDIFFSRNNGLSFTDTIAMGVPNNGHYVTLLSDTPTTNGRIMVRAADHIFLNVNQGAFTIEAPDNPTYTINAQLTETGLCAPTETNVVIETIPIMDYEGEIRFEVDEDLLPQGVVFAFDQVVVNAGETTELIISVNDLEGPTVLDLDILAISDELADTVRYPVLLSLQNTITSSVVPIHPMSGEKGVEGPINFEWEALNSADFYNFKLFDDLTLFSEGVPLQSAEGLVTTSLNPPINYEPSKLYYWTVEAGNRCGLVQSEPIFVFQTPILSCTTLTKEENTSISITGTPTIFSDIDVDFAGEIASVEVLNVSGSHQSFNDMDFWIFPPDAEEQRLLGRSCATYNGEFFMSFSDGAPGPFSCPPDDEEAVYQPVAPLSDLQGSSAQGTWRFRIRDVVAGGGGEFIGWSLRLCSDSPASIPETITNDTMLLRPGSGRFLGNTLLETIDNVKSADEIIYQITSLPKHGVVNYQRFHWEDPTPLQIGSTFSQADIDNNAINYFHDGSDNTEDGFDFIVFHDLGGFIDNQRFNIRTDDDFTSSVRSNELEDAVELFPNPANNILFVKTEGLTGKMQFNIVDLSGKVLISHQVDHLAELTQLNISNLPQGTFILNGIGELETFSKVFVKQ